MNVCNEGHYEVCFLGSSCPACELLELVARRDDEIDDLKSDLKDANDEARSLAQEVKVLELNQE